MVITNDVLANREYIAGSCEISLLIAGLHCLLDHFFHPRSIHITYQYQTSLSQQHLVDNTLLRLTTQNNSLSSYPRYSSKWTNTSVKQARWKRSHSKVNKNIVQRMTRLTSEGIAYPYMSHWMKEHAATDLFFDGPGAQSSSPWNKISTSSDLFTIGSSPPSAFRAHSRNTSLTSVHNSPGNPQASLWERPDTAPSPCKLPNKLGAYNLTGM